MLVLCPAVAIIERCPGFNGHPSVQVLSYLATPILLGFYVLLVHRDEIARLDLLLLGNVVAWRPFLFRIPADKAICASVSLSQVIV